MTKPATPEEQYIADTYVMTRGLPPKSLRPDGSTGLFRFAVKKSAATLDNRAYVAGLERRLRALYLDGSYAVIARARNRCLRHIFAEMERATKV